MQGLYGRVGHGSGGIVVAVVVVMVVIRTGLVVVYFNLWLM